MLFSGFNVVIEPPNLLGGEEWDPNTLENGLDISLLSNSTRNTFLIDACRKGRADIVKELIESDADLNTKGISGLTPLLMAAYFGRVNIVRALRKAGAYLELNDRTNYWLSHIAAFGSLDILKELIYAGLELNCVDRYETLLGNAAQYGKIHIVKYLISSGADVNPQHTANVSSPLIIASAAGRINIVRILLEAGADVNSKDPVSDNIALHEAAGLGHLDIVRELIRAGSFLHTKNMIGDTPLLSAIGGPIDIVRELIRAGSDLSVTNNDGFNSLSMAYTYYRDNRILIDELLFHRCYNHDVLRVKGMGLVAYIKTLTIPSRPGHNHKLLHAIESGDIESIQSTIAAGASINRLSNGKSGLQVAIQTGNLDIVREILDTEGLATWVVIKELKSCVANSFYHQTVLPLLLAHKDTVRLIIRNHHQKAAVAWATTHQCVEAVNAFILSGALVEERDHNGETPLMIAQRLNNQKLIEIFSSVANIDTAEIISFEHKTAPLLLSTKKSQVAIQRVSNMSTAYGL